MGEIYNEGRRMSEMDIEEPYKESNGCLMSKKNLIIVGSVFAIILVGSILATYFGKSCTDLVKDEDAICSKKLCDVPSILTEWNKKCPAAGTTTPLVTIKTSLTTTSATTTSATTTTTSKATESIITNAPTETTLPPVNYRLPRNLIPKLYDLKIETSFKPEEEPNKFSGSVKIHMDCLNDTNVLVMNLKNVTIKSGFQLSLDNQIKKTGNYTYDDDRQMVTFEFDVNSDGSPIFQANNTYVFEVQFEADARSDDIGLYKSSYKDNNGQTRWLLTTQMEAIEARKAFPCFDEPDMKAIFRLSVVHDENLHAISNMPVLSQTNFTNDDGRALKETKFNDTLKMSTYLFAVIISDFDSVEQVANTPLSGSVNVSLWARPNALDQLPYSLNASVEILSFFEEYYNIVYPFPKCDHAAVRDFRFSAMENWGLAIYRESSLLINEKTTKAAIQNVVRTIAHEISHMWFGNLVTPKWWSDLWLNEGFARFMENVGTNKIRPEWKMFEQHANLIFRVLYSDAKESTKPVTADIIRPQEIDTATDSTITYGKGSSIVRMLNYLLGDDTFTKALTRYFNKFAYSNVDQDDLWESVYEQATEDGKLSDITNFKEIMHSWTKQKGHPVVHVKQINNTHISLKQNRFILDSVRKDLVSEDNIRWYIPFTYSIEKLYSENPATLGANSNNLYDKIIWFNPNEDEKFIKLERPIDTSSEFVMANMDTFGFYRVNYDNNTWKLLINQLRQNKDAIPARIRAQLIHDAFALSQARTIKSTIPLDLIEYIRDETEYLPIIALIDRIKFYTDMFESSELGGLFESYLYKLITPLYNKFGWESKPDEEYLDNTIRIDLLRMACENGLDACVKQSQLYFNEWKANPSVNNIPISYRSNVYCTAIKYSTRQDDWDFLFEQHEKSSDSSHKSQMRYGLACTKENRLLLRYLNYVIDQPTEVINNLRNAAKQYGNQITWNFIKDNWDEKIYSKFYNQISSSYTPPMAHLIYDSVSKFNSISQFNDLIAFFAISGTRGIDSHVNAAGEQAYANADWVKQSSAEIKKWLEDYNQTDVEIDYRLPNNLKPTLYEIEIQPYVGPSEVYGDKAFTFDGHVKMHFECEKPTNQIVFHSKGLNIYADKLAISSDDDKDISLEQKLGFDNEREFVKVNLKTACKQGSKYTLNIEYKGEILKAVYGFYRSSYIDSTGKENYLASTHFQPTDARTAFPCMDEPALKAKFKLTIIREKSFSSLGNAVLDKTRRFSSDANWQVDSFKETLEMSTYLVAFAVTNFKKNEMNSTKGVLVEVYGRPEAIDNGEGMHALTEAAKIVDYFSEYFDTEYPLEKSTQLAIPEFNAGAMENWGLIIYRESALLYDEKVDTISNKNRVTTVVAHELAHQWFGNLVTPKWWTDTWLNEGFASYVEYLGINLTSPEYRSLEFFFVDKLQPFVLDSLESSHPISQNVINPNEVNSMFDSISYSKGASLLRMMSVFLKDSVFKKGVNNYLNAYKYSNAEQDDLWEEFNKIFKDPTLEQNETIKVIMDTWTLQKGYPYIQCNVDLQAQKLTVNQHWFLLNPNSEMRQPQNQDKYDAYKWYVPFTFTTQKDKAFELESPIKWIKPAHKDHEIQFTMTENGWIIGNLKHSGWYRVNYDQNNWNLLIKQLKTDHTQINNINRAELIDDAFNLGRAEIIDQLVFLDLASYLENEEDSIAFVPATTGFSYISQMFGDQQEANDLFNKYYEKILTNTYNRLGWNKLDDINDIDLQLRTIRKMCSLGNPDCLKRARDYFNAWKNEGVDLPNNFKSVIYETIIKFGTEQDWLDMFDMAMNKAPSPSEKLRMLRSLTTTSNYNLLKRILRDTTNEEVIRTQDETSMLSSIAANPVGRILVIDYLDENWDYFIKKYGSLSFTLPTLVSNVFNQLNTEFELTRVKEFMARHPVLAVAENAFGQAIENINLNIRWMNTNNKKMVEWLKENTATTDINFRLPDDIKPELYDLKIKAYVGDATEFGDNAFTVDGTMKMHVKCNNPTNKIIFHAKNLKIDESKLKIESTMDTTLSLLDSKLRYDEITDFVSLSFSKPCEKDAQYILTLEYKGKILEDLYGFYRSSYTDNLGKKHYLAVTDFEPTDARNAFPCMDEPIMKAKFKFSLIRPGHLSETFSNGRKVDTNEITDGDSKGWFLDDFEETVAMSTYLMAYAVTDFKTIAKNSSNGTRIEVSARPEAISNNEGDFALDEAAKIIDFFEGYFNVPYPLKKSTHIGIPDFNSGAMENWGLITYRESSLLFNEKSDTISNKRRVSVVVSHELAHQWFGNLVSPKWWNDLWLNEGFASWVEYLGIDSTHPEWRDLEYFFVQKQSTMLSDSLESSHPISVDVNDPSEISTLFDSISYSKGASIIRMMNAFLTEQTFKAGVSVYLKKYQFDNAEQDNLWEELTKQAHKDNKLDASLTVKDIMDTWTLQMGYPVVQCNVNTQEKKIELSQEWFLVNPANKMQQPQNLNEYNKYKWYVPFTFTSSVNSKFDFESPIHWIKPNDTKLELDIGEDNTLWVIGNLKHSGWYRVNYDVNNWKELAKQLDADFTLIDATSRGQLIDDAFYLSMSGRLGVTFYLDLTTYLSKESDSLPLLASFDGFNYLANMLTSDIDANKYFTDYFKKTFKPTYDRLEWPLNVTDVNDIDLQISTLQRMCLYGYQECIDQAKLYFNNWVNDPQTLPNNFKTIVYNTIAKYGSDEDWQKMYDKALKSETLSSEKLRILTSLTNTRDYSRLKFLLGKSSDVNVIRRQDETSFLIALGSNPVSRVMTFEYVDQNWDEFFDRYGEVSFTLPSLVTRGFSRFNTKADLERVENFLKKHTNLGVATLAFQQLIENININVKWMDTNSVTVRDWLKDKNGNF